MACKNCNKVTEKSDRSGLQYSLALGTTTVEGKNGKIYPINTPLIPKMRRPTGGWQVQIYIKGQKMSITGTPTAIFLKVKQLFDLNEIEYTDLQLWFNLNLQWVKKAVERYQLVRYKTLIALAIPNY